MAIRQIGLTTGGNKRSFLGLSTDTKPTIDIGVGSTFRETNTKNKYIFDGASWLEKEMKYKDLGLVIDSADLAAGATVYSNVFTGVQWVNNIVFFNNNNQVINIGVVRIDISGQESAVFYYPGLTNVPATSVAIYNGTTFGNSIGTNNVNSSSAIFGYAVKFALKNNSASTSTFNKLKAQLIGH